MVLMSVMVVVVVVVVVVVMVVVDEPTVCGWRGIQLYPLYRSVLLALYCLPCMTDVFLCTNYRCTNSTREYIFCVTNA